VRAIGVLLVLLAAGAARAEPARPTVAVDFAALDEPAYRRLNALALEQRVVLRLAQEGFAVVARPAEPAILIRLHVLPDRVVIEDAAAPAARRREVMTADEPVRELTHLEIAQKIVELARASRAQLPPPRPAPVVVVTAPPAPGAARPWDWELAGEGGGLVRAGGADAQFGLDLRAGPALGFGARASAMFTPAGGGGVTAREGQLLLGAGHRMRLADRVELEVALLAGGLLHRYALADAAAASPSGTRLDLLGSLPVMVSVWGRQRSLALALRVAPGFSGRGREHTVDGQALWRRGALRLEVGAGIVWRL
jgi:hypothetical protein